MKTTTRTTGSLPHQRTTSARHRDAACAAELESERPEDWTQVCLARRCDETCAAWRITAGLAAALGGWSLI